VAPVIVDLDDDPATELQTPASLVTVVLACAMKVSADLLRLGGRQRPLTRRHRQSSLTV
jgi:hypothetical protein